MYSLSFKKITNTVLILILASSFVFSGFIMYGSTSAADPAKEMKKNDTYYKDPALECEPGKNNCNLMRKYVNPIIGFLTAVAGIAITIGIISGGIRYAAAGDDPAKVSAAKKQIGTAILALVCLLLLYAGLRWLIPGL